MTIPSPYSVLAETFPQNVRDEWRRKCTPELRFRLNVLDACGPQPSDIGRALELREWRVWRAAWETYLYTAYACGLFHGERRKDLLARLGSRNADGFRSAMAECLTCWFLAGKMRFSVSSDMRGRLNKTLDLGLAIEGTNIGVEVKAPFRERPKTTWSGGESDKIAQAIEQANKQFDDSGPNLLVLVPELRVPIRSHRDALLHACFGISVYRGMFDPHTGRAGDFQFEFDPTGKFFRTTCPNGKPLKLDGFPAHRRVSALLCIEEVMDSMCPMPDYRAFMVRGLPVGLRDAVYEQHCRYNRLDNQMWVDHAVILVHNPYALHPLSQGPWIQFPQLIFNEHGVGSWTDGEPAYV